MTHQPRRVETVYDDIKSNLEGQIPGLTNFIDGSFNDAWIDAYAAEIRHLEAKTVAAQFALWIDYAGNSNLTQTDFEAVGISFTGWSTGEIDDFVSDVNDLMEDQHLDEIGALMGVSRDQGSKATGTVTITTASDTTQVNEGLEVATEPDSSGDYVSFFVDADGDGDVTGTETVTPSTGQTTVDVNIIAEDVGSDYNVGANTITFLPDPDPGIEAVNNTTSTSGGQSQQSNDAYRNDIKNAVVSQSGGGTAGGIEGEVENVSGVVDAELDEFVDDDPPHVDVIVDGGSDSDLNTKIDDVKSVGIRHDLVRPENLNIGFRVELIGTDIDSSFTQGEIENYIQGLTLGDSFRRTKLIQRILNADSDIEDIGALSIPIAEVQNESEIFSTGTDKYTLDFEPLGLVEGEQHLFKSGTDKYKLHYDDVNDTVASTLTAFVNGDETDLSEGTDYDLIDDNSDGNVDTIDFSIGGTNPDDRTVFEIEYELNNVAVDANTVTGTLSGSDNTFVESTDYNLIDDDGDGLYDTIDWSPAGDDPDDGTRFFVDYDPKRVVLNDLTATVREKVALDGSRKSLTVTAPA